MKIPEDIYTLRGVVTHHLDDWPAPPGMPPYSIPLVNLAQHFTYSPSRVNLFRGLLEIRKKLKAQGIIGFQWIDGSFVQAETIYGRDPDDIDILTWVVCESDEHFNKLIKEIDCEGMKRENHCHVFFAPAIQGQIAWPHGAYWLWLFGHTNTEKVLDEKDRGLAKGFFSVDLAESEDHITLGGENAEA